MGLKCKRCTYKWESRFGNPKRCPKCKSKYWDEEKKIDKFSKSIIDQKSYAGLIFILSFHTLRQKELAEILEPTQPAISNKLKILLDLGYVEIYDKKLGVRYTINTDKIKKDLEELLTKSIKRGLERKRTQLSKKLRVDKGRKRKGIHFEAFYNDMNKKRTRVVNSIKRKEEWFENQDLRKEIDKVHGDIFEYCQVVFLSYPNIENYTLREIYESMIIDSINNKKILSKNFKKICKLFVESQRLNFLNNQVRISKG